MRFRSRLTKKNAWVALPIVLSLAALTLLSRHYYPFFSDDALITLRYSRRFAEGKGLTWDDFEKVEGYTDLLWVLLCSIPMKLGANGLWTARVLDMIGAVVAVAAVAVSPTTLRWVPSRAWLGSLFLGTLSPLAVWAIGGLEHGFMAGVIIVSLLLIDRARHVSPEKRTAALLLAGIPLSALALLRADGAVLVFAMGLGLVASTRPSLRSFIDLGWLVALPLSAWLLQLGFRIGYYGDFVPNTARAKVAMTETRLLLGIEHVRTGLQPLTTTLLVIALLMFVARRQRLYRVGPALCTSVIWTVYLISVGGDIFPGWRQLLLGLVPLGFVLATLGESVSFRLRPGFLLAPATLLLFGWQLNRQLDNSENQRAKSERWEWEGLSLGPALKRAFSDQAPLMAVDAAGALPYWTEFPAIDMLGLNDRYLATHPPKAYGTNRAVGHDLGDPDYYLRREPDFFAFCNAAGGSRPCFPPSQVMSRRPEFRQLYRPLLFRGLPPRRSLGWLYVRLDGKLGRQETPTGLSYPGYFLASKPAGIPAILQEDDFVFRVGSKATGIMERVRLPKGQFTVKLKGQGTALVSVRCGSVSAGGAIRFPLGAVESKDSPELVVAQGAGPFDLLVAAEKGHAVISGIEFSRTDEPPNRFCPRKQGSVRASLASLTSFDEGNSWLAPPALIMNRSGAVIDTGRVGLGREIVITADNNDEMQLDIRGHDRTTLFKVTAPMVAQPGTRVRRLPVPPEHRGAQVSQVIIRPLRGDGSFSVSGLSLD